jgi:hypothetical protein
VKGGSAKSAQRHIPVLQIGGVLVAGALAFYLVGFAPLFPVHYSSGEVAAVGTASSTNTFIPAPKYPPLDRADYDLRMWNMAGNGTSTVAMVAKALWFGQDTGGAATSTLNAAKKILWPIRQPYPKDGAILPFKRIVAYYGNFYSTGMGVLGQYPPDVMLGKLADTVAAWNAADPSTPVIPAIDYIAVTAQASAGSDGMYRARMPGSQIDKALELADEVHGIVILDVQVGLSNVQTEIPLLKKYLSMPNVHLAIDPEFSMKDGAKPGTEIGTFSSSDINWTINYLASLVKDNDLPPKILVVHRFTQGMVTGTKNIAPTPEVQVVIDMDGWGSQPKKLTTYNTWIVAQPVQFTGFKLFYKNDLKPPSTGMMTPSQVVKLSPKPLFIQYQ